MSKKSDSDIEIPPAHSLELSPEHARELKAALGDSSFAQLVEHNAKLLVALFVIALLGGIGYVGVQFVGRHQEKTAADDLFPIEQRYTKLKEGFDQARMQALMPNTAPKDDKSVQAKPATGNLDQDYGTVIADLEKFARAHAGTSAGGQAAILAADVYLSYKQPEKAADLAKIPAEQLNSKNTLAALARVLWGTALADKGDCQAAVSVWQNLMDNKQDHFLTADVSLRSGVCYEKLGQLDKAAEMYRKASAEGAESSSAGQTAKGFLRALEMKETKNKPAAPVAPNAQSKAGKGGAA